VRCFQVRFFQLRVTLERLSAAFWRSALLRHFIFMDGGSSQIQKRRMHSGSGRVTRPSCEASTRRVGSDVFGEPIVGRRAGSDKARSLAYARVR
jgi:hypothetical protein